MKKLKRWLPIVAIVSIISLISKITGKDNFGISNLLNLDARYESTTNKKDGGHRFFGIRVFTSTGFGAGNPFVKPNTTRLEKTVVKNSTDK